MVRSIAGQGVVRTSLPSSPGGTGFPSSSSTSALIPGKGFVPDPGLSGSEGTGQIMNIPVSVCHHVSMIGQRSFPMTLWYQRHASGLIGSPTDPSKRSVDRS